MDSIFNIDPNNFGFNFSAPDDNSDAIEQGNQPPATIDKKTLEAPFSGISNTFQELYSKSEPTPTLTTTFPKELTEKYKGTAAYSPWMDPFADNEKIAAENFSRWDAITTGLSGLLDNAGISAKEYANSFLRTGRAFLSLDAGYLGGPSEAERMKIAFEQEQVHIDNPIYYSPGDQNDIFSRQFLAESLQNVGFTFGTMGAFAVETALTGGLGKLGSFLPKLFKAGAAARSVELAKIGASSTNALVKEQRLSEAAANIGTQISGKDLYNNALTVAGKLPFVGAIADAAKVMRAGNTIGLTTKELATIGAGGLKRAFSEWNFAAAESAIEAGGTYGEIYDMEYQKYVEENGVDPTGAALDKIRNDAMRASSQGYAINMAILGISNKIQFGNLFRKFGVDGKFLNLFKDESSRVFAVMGKTAGGEFMTKNYTRGLLGAVGHYGDIVEKFSKGAFIRQVGSDLVRGLSKFELIEGIQENLQEGTNEYLKNYYSDLYDDNIASWGDSFKEAVESQSWFGDGAGFKTFLQGALTGFFISPVTGAVEAVADAYNTKANPNHKTALDNTLNELNLFYANPDDVLKESVANIKRQQEYNTNMMNAAGKNQKYEYFNNKDSSIIRLALNAKRTGTFDAFKTYLKELGNNLDAAEFKEATGLDVKDIKISPATYMNNLVEQLDRYSEIYDKYNIMYGDYLSMDVISSDPYRKMKFSVAQAALRDAIQTVAFNEAKAQDSTIRAKNIVQNITNVQSIGQSAAANFNTIVDYDKISEQRMILESEIKLLEESTDKSPATKALIRDKKKELDLLGKWGDNFYTGTTEADKGTTYNPLDLSKLSAAKKKELSSILAEYYTIKNKQLNIDNPVTAADVNSILQDINDYQKLSRDSREYIEAVNILTDPQNAIKTIQKYADARVAAYARHAHDTYTKLADISQVFKDYVTNEPQELEALLAIARNPEASLESIDKVKDHLDNLTKMRSKKQEEDVKKAEDLQQQFIAQMNAELSKYVNISAMSPEDAASWIQDHYMFPDENPDILIRYYTDLDGNIVKQKEWHLDTIGEYFKIENFTGLIDDEIVKYAGEFAKAIEQKYYNEQENISAIELDPIVAHDELIYQIKKIKKLEGQKVLRNGLPGIIALEEDKYVINHVDGSVSLLGPAVSAETEFEWAYNEDTKQYVLQEVLYGDEQDTLDDYSDITLLPDNMSVDFQNMTGISTKSLNVRIGGRAHQIELIDDKFINIDGKKYSINKDAKTGEISSLIHDEAGSVKEFTRAKANKKPNSLDAKYLALVDTFLLIKKPAGELSDSELDAIINSLSAKKTTTTIIRPAGQAVNDSIELGADNLINRSINTAIADIMDRYLSDDVSVTSDEKQKLYNWAVDTIEKLVNLDKNHPVVQDYVQLLNDLIINPLYKTDGLTNTRKQSKKPLGKKTKAAKVTKQPGTRPDQPSSPGTDKSQTPEGTEEFINNAYTNLAKQKARRIDEFFKSSTGGAPQFTASDIKKAKREAKISKSTYQSGIESAETKTNPFEDPEIIQNLNSCNT